MKQVIVGLVLALTASVSFADTKPAKATPVAKATKVKDAGEMVTDDCARATKLGKKCVVNMDADQVGGSVASGNGFSVGVLTTDKQPSLIRIRKDFIAEMIKTTEDL